MRSVGLPALPAQLESASTIAQSSEQGRESIAASLNLTCASSWWCKCVSRSEEPCAEAARQRTTRRVSAEALRTVIVLCGKSSYLLIAQCCRGPITLSTMHNMSTTLALSDAEIRNRYIINPSAASHFCSVTAGSLAFHFCRVIARDIYTRIHCHTQPEFVCSKQVPRLDR